ARADAELAALRVHLDAENRRAVERSGKRLRPAHAAHPAGDHQPAREVGAEMLPPGSPKCFIGSLQDSLCPNVNPTAGGHLAVHDEPEALELVELLPSGPVADQVGVGDEHARRPLVSPENTDWFSRLNEQGFVVFEGLE